MTFTGDLHRSGFVRVFVVGFVLATTACGDSNKTLTTSTPIQANITLSASPNPVTATTCSPACIGSNTGNSFQFKVTGTLNIQETAGIGGIVDSISTTWCSPACVYSSSDITTRSGTARVEGKGTLVFPLNFVYGMVTNPNASRSTVIPLTVQFTDDRGNKLSSLVQWVAN